MNSEKRNWYDLFEIYKNYLYALQIRGEFGIIYGDTDEIINMYETILKSKGVKLVRKRLK